MSSLGSSRNSDVSVVLGQIFAQIKVQAALIEGLLRKMASNAKAGAATEALRAQDQQEARAAQAQAAHLVKIQFDKVEQDLASFKSGSSDRSSPKSAMEGNSQTCSEIGKSVDTGAAQIVSEEMLQMPAEMP